MHGFLWRASHLPSPASCSARFALELVTTQMRLAGDLAELSGDGMEDRVIAMWVAAGLMAGSGTAPPAAQPSRSQIVLTQYDNGRGGDYVGTGKRFGRGWSRSKKGRIYTGTGRDFGGGFEGNGKRWTGTGKRFGGGYDVEAGGRRIVGTGTNFGKRWERSGDEWIGTGGNFGKHCPARPGSSFVPCM
jgi:hypothetical protein